MSSVEIRKAMLRVQNWTHLVIISTNCSFLSIYSYLSGQVVSAEILMASEHGCPIEMHKIPIEKWVHPFISPTFSNIAAYVWSINVQLRHNNVRLSLSMPLFPVLWLSDVTRCSMRIAPGSPRCHSTAPTTTGARARVQTVQENR